MSTKKMTAEIKQQIDRYKRFMQDNEYTPQTALGYSAHLSRFYRLTPKCGNDSLQKNINDFLESQRQCTTSGPYKECRAALRLFYRMETGERFPKCLQKEHNQEIELILSQFYDYSISVKGNMPRTVLGDMSHLRGFLEYAVGDGPCRIEDITAFEIRDFVVERLACLADSSKGSVVQAIRNFFRYRKFEGHPVHDSIFLMPLSPAVWRNASFPTTMDEEVFKTLAEVPDQGTQTGKRDCCIVLCFTELALRCAEVASLTLDDFNWRDGYVSIRNTKTHRERRLPITGKLGRAIAEYIQAARPDTADRTLFVRFKHVCGEPMGASQIRGAVRRVYEKSGAEIASTGTHILRRTAGTLLYNAGNSLKLTADILGHESLDSTVRYTKADIAGLRQAAGLWPGSAGKAGAQNAG